MNSIGFIGAGRITKIFLEIFSGSNEIKNNIVVSDVNEDVIEEISKKYPSVKTTTSNKIPAENYFIILALHPPVISEVLDEIKDVVSNDSIIISLAPKITIKQISERLIGSKNIVRSIPNSPSIIGKGYNPIAYSKDFQSDKKIIVNNLFDKLGVHFETDELNLETYAIITAMGPTYFQFQFNKLFELGKKFGLSDRDSKFAVKNMVDGTNKLLFDSELMYEQVEYLIPIKPLQKDEENILSAFDERLNSLYEKLNNRG